VKRVEQLNREEGKLMACEERRTAEQRRKKADSMWREEDSWTDKKEADDNWREYDFWTEKKEADDKWREEDSWTEMKESWWQVKRVWLLNREEGSWWQVKRVGHLNREEGKLMRSEGSRTADHRRRKADDKWRKEFSWA
jgi:hypothetical protein